jgi:hypothetical protein
MYRALLDLKSSIRPTYEILFDHVQRLPEGLLFLVHLREDLLVKNLDN